MRTHPRIALVSSFVVCVTTGCVPLLMLDGAPCPCADGYTCCDGACSAGDTCGGPNACGNNILDEGEVCDPGLDASCGDASAPLFSVRCASDCQSVVTASCDLPLDLLIVVDNSGSMCEEQEALRRGLWDPLCPITDLDDIPPAYANASPSMIESLAQTCGLMQLLAILSPSIHIGVITTDASACDNDFGISEIADHPNQCDGVAKPGWGRRSQRGCLQGVVEQGSKVIRSGDDDLVDRIATTVGSVGTFGSAFERGFDAIEAFLDDDTTRPLDCEHDRDDFLRHNARLAVLIISDEDDCSHDDNGAFGNENVGESCAAGGPDFPAFTPNACYDSAQLLSPVSQTATFLRELKGNPDLVSVLFLGGVTKGPSGYVPAGCRVEQGVPSTTCTPSFGNSNYSTFTFPCNPEHLLAEGLPPCCEADGAPRYHQFIESFDDRGYMSSICVDEVADSVRDVGIFLGALNRPLIAE